MSETLAEIGRSEKATRYNHELRGQDDTATWLAEVLDGSMRSEFSYTFDGEELFARDGRPLGPIFTDAVSDAEQTVKLQPELSFELRRRKIEQVEYEDIQAMARGDAPNTMIVVSDHPEELWDKANDSLGYNVARRKTMLRVITCQDGLVTVISQSLDMSNRRGLEALFDFLGEPVQRGELLGQRIKREMDKPFQDDLMDTLTRVYDNDLQAQYGGEWYAGRTPADRTNTMHFAMWQTDLINTYLSGSQDATAKFNLAAAVTARFEGKTKKAKHTTELVTGVAYISSAVEMEMRGRVARQENRIFSGCGFTADGSTGVESELNALGYGDADKKIETSENDQFGSLTFNCKKGHKNKRPRGKLIDCCTTCGDSVKC